MQLPPLDNRQIATILASLRMWQRETDWEVRVQDDIASNEGTLEPLNDEEIDHLYQVVNFGMGDDAIFKTRRWYNPSKEHASDCAR